MLADGFLGIIGSHKILADFADNAEDFLTLIISYQFDLKFSNNYMIK